MVDIAKPPGVLVPSARTPGQFAGPGIEGGVGQAGVALGRSIQALARPLMGFVEQIERVQDAGEEAQIQGLVAAERKDMEIYMDANGDHTTYEARWAEADARIKKAIESTTRKRTQDRLGNWYTKNSPIWSASVTQRIQNGIGIKTRADTLTAIDEIITADLRDDAKAASDEEKGVYVDEQEVKFARIIELLNNANVNGSIWNEEELRILQNQIKAKIDSYVNTRHLAEESEIVYEAINAKQYDLADSLTGTADISEKDKTDLHNKINASRKQNEQRLEDREQALQTENQARIASDIYANEIDASVIDANINAALLSDEEGVWGLTVAMAKSLKELNKREDVVTSDETNIEIDRLVRSVRSGERTYDEAIEEYTTKIAKGVNPTEGAQNLDDIRLAADSAKDPILNRPVVIRGHQALDRVRAAAIKLLGTDFEIKDVVDIENQILKRATALDDWAVQNKDDPNFTEKFQSEVKRQTTPIVEEITLHWLGRLLRAKEATPFFGRFFGTTEEEALAKKKAKAGIEKEGEILEPKTIEEFNETVSNIEDDEEAKAYYEKWKDKW